MIITVKSTFIQLVGTFVRVNYHYLIEGGFSLFIKISLMLLSACIAFKASATGSLDGVRILFAEDSLSIREDFITYFTRKGARVKALVSAEEARAELAGGAVYDIFISDNRMLRLEGWELIVEIKQSNRSSLPCILYTADHDDPDIIESLAGLEKTEIVPKRGLRIIEDSIHRLMLESDESQCQSKF